MASRWRAALISVNWTIWEHRLLAGALRYADSHPRFLVRVFAPTKDIAATAKEIEDWGADGAFGFLEHADLLQFLKSLTKRLPFVNSALAYERPGVVSVLGDVNAFVEMGVGHLRQLGLRSLAMAVLEAGPEVERRLVQPFLRFVKPADPDRGAIIYPVDRALLWDPEADVSPVPAPLAKWLQALPTPVGLLCPMLGGGGYLIRCCKALGLRVPEDIAIVGSDETDLSLASNPTLTSVWLSVETLGQEALRVLSDMMAGVALPASVIRLKCAELNVRGSTGQRRPEICDIAGALECIRDHATRGITVGQVIRQTQKVSKVTFHRRFQEVVGKSPAEAIRERKLNEARRLLAGTELPLNMISDLCGFSSARVLARAFREADGLTPTNYRRRHSTLGQARRPARLPKR